MMDCGIWAHAGSGSELGLNGFIPYVSLRRTSHGGGNTQGFQDSLIFAGHLEPHRTAVLNTAVVILAFLVGAASLRLYRASPVLPSYQSRT